MQKNEFELEVAKISGYVNFLLFKLGIIQQVSGSNNIRLEVDISINLSMNNYD